MKTWYLEGYTGPRRAFQRIRITGFPFRVGRAQELPLVLDSDGISREHAELRWADDHVVLSDLNSTNGTFLNRERIRDTVRVEHGDVLHFGEEEFRLISEEQAVGGHHETTRQGVTSLPEHLPVGGRELYQLVLNRQVGAVFQPIVRYSDAAIHAWEILGRGRHPGLSESPRDLFRIAESLGLEVRISELLRGVGLEQADAMGSDGPYFANIHPAEMQDEAHLLRGIGDLHRSHPRLRLVMEIHEAAVVDTSKLQRIRERLREQGIGLAYDDFGRGQARLVELADVPPDYIKLDIDLIRDIDRKSPANQQLVRMLADYANDNDILVIAEGVNTDGELEFCTAQGIDLMQGFRFGEPGALTARD